MATATLKMLLLGEDRSASKALKTIGAESDKAGHKLHAFGGLMGTAAKAGALAIGTLGVGLIGLGVKTAAANEVAQNSFTTLLGSGKKAAAFLQELTKFAAATPFDLPGVETAAQQLLNVGLKAKQVVPFLTAFGDASSAAGQTTEQFNSTMTQTVQAISKGKFSIGDLNQISSNGVPVTKLLAEAWHTTTGKIQEMAEAGDLTAKKVLPALQKQMEKDYGGGMARQSQTLIGLWSTFKDTISQAMAKALVPLMPLLKDGLTSAINSVSKAAPKITKAFQDMAPVAKQIIAIVVETAKDLAHNLGPAFQDVSRFVRTHRDLINRLVPVIAALAAGIIAATVAVRVWSVITRVASAVTRTFAVAQAALNLVLSANPIALVVIALAALAAGFVIAYKHSAKFREVVQGAFHAIAEAGRWMWDVVLQPVVHGLLSAFASVMDFYAAMLRGLSHVPGFGWAKKAADAISHAADKVRDLNHTLGQIPAHKTVHVDVLVNQSGDFASSVKGQRVGHNASGTSNWRGGLSWVGERGPELVNLPRGSQVIPAGRSAAMSGGDQIVINFNGLVTDPVAVGKEIQRVVRKAQLAQGRPVTI